MLAEVTGMEGVSVLRKVRSKMAIGFVFPRVMVDEYLQACAAKKKEPRSTSAHCAKAGFWEESVSLLQKEKKMRRNLGVSAFCLFGGGSSFT